jgi:hypothetical protein
MSYTSILPSEIKFRPFLVELAGLPVPPAVPGMAIFTTDGRIFIGDDAAAWVQYNSLINVSSLDVLNQMEKETSRLYCVGKNLYKWNGTALLKISVEEAPDDGNSYVRKNNQWVEVEVPDITHLAEKTELSALETLIEEMELQEGPPGPQGTSFKIWNTAADLTNISSISGAKVGDYIINGDTATRTILGVSTAVGGAVLVTSATTGTAAGNLRGPTGAAGAAGASAIVTIMTASQFATANAGSYAANSLIAIVD